VKAGQALIGAQARVFEAPGLVARFDDLAVMGEAVEERRGHLCVAEDGRPFTECEVGGDDDRCALVEAADEVEEQLPAGLREGQIAEFIEDDEVEAGHVIGEPSLLAAAGLGLEPVYQIDDVVEAAAGAVADERAGDGNGEMGLAGSGAADEDHVALVGDEAAIGQFPNQPLVDRCSGEVELFDVLGQGQLGDGHLVSDGSCLLLGDLGLQQISNDAGRFMLALDACGHDLVISAAHPVELEAAHQV